MSAVERIFPRRITQGELRTLRMGLLVLVWTAMLALIIWGKGGVLDLLQLKREVANLQAEIDTLRQENDGLKKELKRLQTDPAAYEGPAREMLLRKKPGEVVLYLPPAGVAPKIPQPAANAPSANSVPPAPVPAAANSIRTQVQPSGTAAPSPSNVPQAPHKPPPDAQVPAANVPATNAPAANADPERSGG